MKLRFLSACAVAACVIGAGGGTAAAQEAKPAQQAEQPKVSGGERSAAEKITKAKGPEARLQAAAEFIQKFPQSALRPQITQGLAEEIANTQDAQLRASLADTYAAIFTGPGEAELMTPILLDAHILGDRAEDAFRAAGPWLQKNPEDFDTLRRLSTTALNASIRGNNAFLEQGRQHGLKALELLAADKRPANIEAAKWAESKAKWEAGLHREVGVIAFRLGDRAAARTHLERAAALRHADPAVYFILGDMLNEDYNTLAKQYTVAPAGEKEAALKKAQEALDRVINVYAQVVALTDGNAQYAAANAQVRQDLEKYYRYRNNDSAAGLQQLIDKYKGGSQ
jgi:hypothetical protein